jgi:hypothetical protein
MVDRVVGDVGESTAGTILLTTPPDILFVSDVR